VADQESLTLPGVAQSARAAREFTAACLPGCPSAYEAMVCVDELVANAVQHSRSGLPGGTLTVRISADPGCWLRVDVVDAGPRLRLVTQARAGDVDEHGRGLALVDALAYEHGGAPGLHWFRMAWGIPGACVPAPRPSAPDAAQLRRNAVLNRSAGMCQCTGQCGRPGHRCGHGDVPGRRLHIVAADPRLSDIAAAAAGADDLMALCPACRSGRDRVTARTRAAAAPAADVLFALPVSGGRP
jgi:anti-sigma regulatory factor (Ser/Thr protein kinase)